MGQWCAQAAPDADKPKLKEYDFRCAPVCFSLPSNVPDLYFLALAVRQ